MVTAVLRCAALVVGSQLDDVRSPKAASTDIRITRERTDASSAAEVERKTVTDAVRRHQGLDKADARSRPRGGARDR
jgi:hypothetical protein